MEIPFLPWLLKKISGFCLRVHKIYCLTKFETTYDVVTTKHKGTTTTQRKDDEWEDVSIPTRLLIYA